MKEKNHPGGRWTAHRAVSILVLLALVASVSASTGQFVPAFLPPAPLGPPTPLGPPAPLSPPPPLATPDPLGSQEAVDSAAALDPLPPSGSPEQQSAETSAMAAVGCRGAFCAYLPLVPSSPAVQSASPQNRSGAQSLYRSMYLAAASAVPSWTGSVSSCSAGQTSSAFRDAVLARINYFRSMAGIPKLQALDASYNNLDQHAALMMSANNSLSHTPPTSWKCYTQAGRDGAGSSNLYLGDFGPNAITGYMRDPGAGNTAAGHRRWILYPQTRKMGTGDIPAGNGYAHANALRSWDENYGGPRPATRDEFVAWPPPVYVPYQVVFPRWSFAYPGASFQSATVSMTRRGASVPVTVYAPVDGFGENTLVWLVNNMGDFAEWPRPSGDDPYVVTIRNVVINGQPRDFTYTVTVIDPQ